VLKAIAKKGLSYFDLTIVRKSGHDRLLGEHDRLLGERADLQKICASAPWLRYWAVLGEEERDLIKQYLPHSKAQLGQDLFAFNESRGNPNGKFFIEFGAADGMYLSNSWLLEKKLGWNGIVAEPAKAWHESLRRNRACSIDTRCVAARTGDKVAFLEVESSPELSAISSLADNGDWASKTRLENPKEYSVETVSLNDLLREHRAPEVVDYMSLDTEGGELDILRAFDFEKYRVRVITVEHNYRDDMRAGIFDLLSAKGFVRKHPEASLWDDWYVLQEKI